MARRDRSTPRSGEAEGRDEARRSKGASRPRQEAEARPTIPDRGELEAAVEDEGIAGEGEEASGTIPGSTAGTTGTAGHVGGIQSPGADYPSVPGIDPEEAIRLRRGQKRRP